MVARLFDKNENNKIKCIIHAILLAGFLICALLKCNQICSYLLVEDNMQWMGLQWGRGRTCTAAGAGTRGTRHVSRTRQGTGPRTCCGHTPAAADSRGWWSTRACTQCRGCPAARGSSGSWPAPRWPGCRGCPSTQRWCHTARAGTGLWSLGAGWWWWGGSSWRRGPRCIPGCRCTGARGCGHCSMRWCRRGRGTGPGTFCWYRRGPAGTQSWPRTLAGSWAATRSCWAGRCSGRCCPGCGAGWSWARRGSGHMGPPQWRGPRLQSHAYSQGLFKQSNDSSFINLADEYKINNKYV